MVHCNQSTFDLAYGADVFTEPSLRTLEWQHLVGIWNFRRYFSLLTIIRYDASDVRFPSSSRELRDAATVVNQRQHDLIVGPLLRSTGGRSAPLNLFGPCWGSYPCTGSNASSWNNLVADVISRRDMQLVEQCSRFFQGEVILPWCPPQIEGPSASECLKHLVVSVCRILDRTPHLLIDRDGGNFSFDQCSGASGRWLWMPLCQRIVVNCSASVLWPSAPGCHCRC